MTIRLTTTDDLRELHPMRDVAESQAGSTCGVTGRAARLESGPIGRRGAMSSCPCRSGICHRDAPFLSALTDVETPSLHEAATRSS
jgi:hypothetical protein